MPCACQGCTALRTLKLERVGIRQPHKGVDAIAELIETPGIKLDQLRYGGRGGCDGGRASPLTFDRDVTHFFWCFLHALWVESVRRSLSGNRASEQSMGRLAAALHHPGVVMSHLILGGCNLTDATVAPLLNGALIIVGALLEKGREKEQEKERERERERERGRREKQGRGREGRERLRSELGTVRGSGAIR